VELLTGLGGAVGVSGVARVVANALPASVAAAGISRLDKVTLAVASTAGECDALGP